MQFKQRDIPQNIDDEIQNFERENERDIEPMIEDGENVEWNSSEEIESLDMYMYMLNTHVYYWNYTYLLI